jgi:tripartite-type tricarboxylate transporter receptor subunit TctC
MRLNLKAVAMAAVTAVCAVTSALAQGAFPNRPITLIVPTAAGGPTDTVARLIAESMARDLGQSVVIENLSGAGGTTGMGRLAQRPADGYTIAIWHIAHATSPALYDNLRYDPVNDFDHLGRITDVPMSLVAKSGVSATNVDELIAWIRKEKDNVTFGHAGVGSAAHLCSLMLMKEWGVQMRGVAYRGTGPAMNDLIGGQFDFMCDQTTNTAAMINENRIKGFAVTTKFKVATVPQLPTLDSGAMPGFEVSAWHAMWAPKGLPADVAAKLNGALKLALKDAKVVERFTVLGIQPVPEAQQNGEALRSHLAAEVGRWGTAIRAAGVKGN